MCLKDKDKLVMNSGSSGIEDKSADMTSVAFTPPPRTGESVVTSPASPMTSSMTSPSTSDAGFYFQCIVVVVGVVGTAANAVILYALVASKHHTKHLLIFNQNALDLASCLFLVVTYSVKLCNVYLTGTLGYWLCMMILSENILWWTIVGSTINLISITVERYLKVVHPVWSKKWLRRWMVYSAMVFAWIGGFVANAVPIFLTSAVKDGVCHSVAFWKSRAAELAYGIWYFISFYVVVLSIFVYCYGRILVIIRRQATAMTKYCSVKQSQQSQMQANVIKTMVIVSAFFAITWTPLDIYYLLIMINSDLSLLDTGYYALISLAFLYICTNPFIYATKFDPVRRTLLRLFPCPMNSDSQQPPELVALSSTSTRPVQK